MKKILPVLVIAIVIYGYGLYQDNSISRPSGSGSATALQQAFANRQSDIQVKGSGVVDKVLRDDLDGSRHQKFILKLSSGLTLLVSHNIDLVPRVTNLKKGDSVEFYGEYEWNAQGGVIPWTHHDPGGRHEGGWLKHQGNTYH
jgi:hypothetical protein